MQQMTFDQLQLAYKEPILKGDSINVGDWITHRDWKGKAYLICERNTRGIYTRYRISNIPYENGDMGSKVHWGDSDSFFWGGCFFKVIPNKDYDPKQQPYEDSDI